ncbi:4'-phosphopantetheinyl transferase [Aquicoccus sp. G2-2]|uniref:4'-phosphopantetheinyl transferase family protein n=1 Tax=Aquicoccus sp. G2-2 TaxID=3092120 RepID=UPI002AE090F6|nr:4'-phosphopantetheinyl transferase superfamily protein [Aquicoccus sp. G2-2]MEA1112586.1 4'-phosphopantetheinyl transferase superfamily protein [Aquicoccus sp. G2-2]
MALDLPYLASLEAAIGALTPGGVVVCCTDPGAPEEGALFAAEAAAVARAVPKRRAEFAAGRAAAHGVMERLGLLPAPVPMGADRAPIWPEGVIGSISHCAGVCVAVAAQAENRLCALGVDIEPDADLPEEVIATICLPGERVWLAQHAAGQRGRAARLIFSAKEAAFKMQYGLTGEMLGFDAFEIVPEMATGRLQARFEVSCGRFARGARLNGRFGRADGFVFCLMYEC